MPSELNDSNSNIEHFKQRVKEFVDERNWNKYHTPKSLIQAMGIEVSELSELFLFKDLNIDEVQKDPELMENISDEVADIFIYLLSFINTLDIDLTEVCVRKMKKNDQKYSTEEFSDGSYRKK